ncbi:MAG: CDP-alcohol phosphatidyltransferase family protein [Ruminococcus sp.]|nr:CDP-alcohol phosphatidyltransferase family protein [Ruminococcus sp.]
MIGFYNYTVILTYMSLASAVVGITQVFEGHERIAILCLLISGICDLFDGKVARHKKDRTDQEKLFGIQIDSLCDLVAFGVLPACIGYNMGFNYGLGLVSAILIVLCGLIRLGYFNVKEEERQRTTAENRKEYQGVPITTSSIILPLLFLAKKNIPDEAYPYVFQGFMVALALLFVLNIKVKKLSARSIFIMFTLAALVIIGLWTLAPK